jgi:hypothetical protein
MFGSREAVETGGLISYAVSVAEVFRRSAVYVDKILKGAKPADFGLAVKLHCTAARGASRRAACQSSRQCMTPEARPCHSCGQGTGGPRRAAGQALDSSGKPKFPAQDFTLTVSTVQTLD